MPARPGDRPFYTAMAAVVVFTVFAGFARTFYLRGLLGAPGKALTPLLAIHGALFSCWVGLFVVQVRLVAARRVDLHRRLGIAAALVAAALPVVGFLAAVDSARRGFSPPGGPPPLVFIALPLADLVVFATLAGLGLALRRRSEAHKRLMLLATLAILPPAIARLPGLAALGPLAFFGLVDVVLVSAVVYDRLRCGRFHPAFLWGGLFLVLSQPLRLLIAGTPAWMTLATWLTR